SWKRLSPSCPRRWPVQKKIEAACWAHARRKIHDVYISTQTATAEEALKRIGELYVIEEEIRGRPEAE
ncbi:transposase, IS66 family, partial [Serratia symbiotica str. Tucson]